MNRVVNVLSFIVAIVYCFIAVALVYDLSFSSMMTLKGMPFKIEITAGLALLLLLLGSLRVKRRWLGMKDIKEYSKFTFVVPISKTAKNHAIVATAIEGTFMFALFFLCFKMMRLEPQFAIPMMAVTSLLMLEVLLFILRIRRGGAGFRIGVSPQVIALFNREIQLYYFTGLKRVELLEGRINLQYKDDLNLILPTDNIAKEDRKAFRDELIKVLEPKNVFIDDAFRVFE